MAGVRRTIEERAERAEARAQWTRAEAEAVKRPEVAVLLKAVRGIDVVVATDEGSGQAPVGRAMTTAREACVASLKALGVAVP